MIPTIRLRFSPTTPKLRARVYPGIPPLQAEFRNNGTSIQWRVGASGAWTDIATLASITGPVAAVVAGTGIAVDSTDITHPIVSLGSKPDARDYLDVASYVETRAALKALDTSKESVAYLKEAGREGMFLFTAGNYAARVTADTGEFTYIKADDTASSAGAWVRADARTVDANHFYPTMIYSDAATWSGIREGSSSSPVSNNDPIAFWQKYVSLDNASDPHATNVGILLADLVVKGSGTTNETEGTWIGIGSNTILKGVNIGTEGAPEYDIAGDAIGASGFAQSDKPNNGIITGLWAYATSPSLTDIEFAASPYSWAIVGLEVNIEHRHKAAGAKTVFSGNGVSAGILLSNYRAASAGVRDWTFGMVLNGVPNDGNYTSTDVDNWNGFYTGILIDKIKTEGIRFGQYFKTGSYGLRFPDTYAGSQEPAAAIHLGNSKLQLGEYVGSTFNANDFWHNAGGLYFRYSGTTEKLLTQRGTVINIGANRDFITPNGEQFAIGDTVSSVNFLAAYGGATGLAPSLVAGGTDTNVGISLITKGTGQFAVLANGAIQFVSGAVASAANWLSLSGATTSNPPVLEAVGGDTNIDIRLKAKGTGIARILASALSPNASDGAALGSTSLMWSDAFLASGAVVNFNNGDVSVTHSTGLLTSNGNLSVSKANPSIFLSKTASGQGNDLWGLLNGVARWQFSFGDAQTESGSDTGSALVLNAYSDAAAFIDTPFQIVRAAGGRIITPRPFASSSSIKSSSATAGIGYSTGAGGTVTQTTSKSTGVTLSKVTGAITMNNAALAAGIIVSFVLTNTALAATDQIVVTHESGGTLGAYTVNGRATGAGTGEINVRNNTGGSLSEALVLRVTIIKSINS